MEFTSKLSINGILSIFICLLCLVHNKITVTGKNPAPKDCEPKSCGNNLNISYPFWLEGQQPDYCGYPPLKLRCKDNRTTNSIPVLTVFSSDFYIKDIFYDNQSFLIIPAEFAGNHCPLPSGSFLIDIYPLSVSPSNDIIVFLLNCSTALDHYDRVSCAGNGTFDYFGGLYESSTELNSVSGLCQFVEVPTVSYSVNDSNDFVASLNNGFVLDWNLPVCGECKETGGSCGYDNSTDYFMCICSDRVHKSSCNASKATRKMTIIMGVVFPLLGSCLLLLLLYLLCIRKAKSRNMQRVNQNIAKDPHSVETFLNNYGLATPKKYKYSEIKTMTKSFSSELGKGGYGSVYEGTLPNGHLVAVKVLNEAKGNGEDFMNEVASISRTSHVNIVSLLGYCVEKSKRALVYEYMPNGSLEKFIYAKKSEAGINLGWTKLYEIAIGIARGLEYLHRGCNTRIVHFDIKPHNILLDKDFTPKISDFGLAKLCSRQDSIVSMLAPRGTVGYIAPEVFSRNFGVVSTKSDVYSYGMMVLEMVGGRKNIDGTIENLSEIYFPHWVYDHLDFYVQSESSEVTGETEELARKMIIVSLWCIQTMSEKRPSMSMVVAMLHGNLHDLQLPPKP